MATINITGSFCTGGNHAELTLKVNNVVQGVWHGLELDDIAGPISDDDKLALVRLLIRTYKLGKTNAQVKSALVAGIAVTV